MEVFLKQLLLIIFIVLIFLSSCTITPPSSSRITPKPESIAGTSTSTPAPVINNKINILITEYSWVEDFLKNDIAHEFNLIKGDLTEDELIIKLLSGDKSFDMFLLKSDIMHVMPIIDNHYYVDLFSSKEISSHIYNMYDVIRKESIVDDELFGFPVYLKKPFSVAINLQKISDLDKNSLDIKTFGDIFILDDILEKNNSFVFNRSMVYEVFIRDLLYLNFDKNDYNIDFIDLDIAEVKKTINELENREMLVDDSISGSTKLGLLGYSQFYIEKTPASHYDKTINISDSSLMIIRWLVINPYSDNIEMCLDFLADYGELQKTDINGGSKFMYLDYFYKDEDTYIDNALGEQPYHGATKDRLDMQMENLENAIAFWRFDGYDECAEILMQYYNYEIKEDVAIQKMQKIMDNVSKEYTLD